MPPIGIRPLACLSYLAMGDKPLGLCQQASCSKNALGLEQKSLIFKEPPKAGTSKIKQEIQNLQSDCALFSRMYISCQSRDGDLDDFFKHENLSYPNHYQMEGN